MKSAENGAGNKKGIFLDTDWLENDEIKLVLEKTVDAGKDAWLPTYCFAIYEKRNVKIKIGVCDLRIGHNENVYYGGNIGYKIEEAYRGHHYAAKACLLLFELAKRHCMEYVIITCNPDNDASRKTCEYAGGILKEIVEVPEGHILYAKGDTYKCIYEFLL